MKTVLITGANRGIGLAHAEAFAAAGAKVFATARKPNESGDLNRLAERYPIELLRYDARDADGPAQLKAALGQTALDLLFANAGAIAPPRGFGETDSAEILDLVQNNALAPLKLAEALADNVARSERKLMAFQSSQMGSIGDNSSGGHYAYRISKVALNMVARSAAAELRSRGVTVLTLHPGWVRTRMGGAEGKISVNECVAGQQEILRRATIEHSGRFFNYDGAELPW